MAARFCPQCGREISSTAQFCTNCGAALSASAQQTTSVNAATNATRRVLVPATITALIVLAIAVALLASKAHQPVTAANSEPPSPSLLSAPTVPPAAPAVTNVASAPPSPSAPITNSASKPAPQLPAEDAQYLQFLQGIEQRRVVLANDVSGASGMQDAASNLQSQSSDPDQQDQQGDNIQKTFGKLSQGYSDNLTKWQLLTADFRQVQPPSDCSDIASKYFSALADYSDIISKTQVILKTVHVGSTPDMSALMQLQQTLQEAQTKVNSDLTGADTAIGLLCTHYDVTKPFSIQVDGGSSPLTGM